jgi:hypothetical protein
MWLLEDTTRVWGGLAVFGPQLALVNSLRAHIGMIRTNQQSTLTLT